MTLLKGIFSNKSFFKVFFFCVLMLRLFYLLFTGGKTKEIFGLVSLGAIFFIVIWVGVVYGFTNWWDDDFKWKRKKSSQ